MAGNYLLSYTKTNCGNAPEARDGYFTTYYLFNKIVLDVITEKFDIQVDENTQIQAALLHGNIPGYDLPLRYDDAPPGEYEYSQPSTGIGGTSITVPRTFTFASYPLIGTRYGYTVRIYYQDVL